MLFSTNEKGEIQLGPHPTPTVADMIALLQQYPPTHLVYIMDDQIAGLYVPEQHDQGWIEETEEGYEFGESPNGQPNAVVIMFNTVGIPD